MEKRLVVGPETSVVVEPRDGLVVLCGHLVHVGDVLFCGGAGFSKGVAVSLKSSVEGCTRHVGRGFGRSLQCVEDFLTIWWGFDSPSVVVVGDPVMCCATRSRIDCSS